MKYQLMLVPNSFKKIRDHYEWMAPRDVPDLIPITQSELKLYCRYFVNCEDCGDTPKSIEEWLNDNMGVEHTRKDYYMG